MTPSDGLEPGPAVDAGSRLRTRNSPPMAPSLIFIPDVPVEGVDDVWCGLETPSSDADWDAVAYTFDWSVDGEPWLRAVSTTQNRATPFPSRPLAGQVDVHCPHPSMVKSSEVKREHQDGRVDNAEAGCS